MWQLKNLQIELQKIISKQVIVQHPCQIHKSLITTMILDGLLPTFIETYCSTINNILKGKMYVINPDCVMMQAKKLCRKMSILNKLFSYLINSVQCIFSYQKARVWEIYKLQI